MLQILGYSYEGVLPLLVLEYCNGGGLDKIIFDHSQPLSVAQQLTLIAGIARGILHLHNNNVVHRDIAARNVLVSAHPHRHNTAQNLTKIMKQLSSSGDPKVAVRAHHTLFIELKITCRVCRTLASRVSLNLLEAKQTPPLDQFVGWYVKVVSKM